MSSPMGKSMSKNLVMLVVIMVNKAGMLLLGGAGLEGNTMMVNCVFTFYFIVYKLFKYIKIFLISRLVPTFSNLKHN